MFIFNRYDALEQKYNKELAHKMRVEKDFKVSCPPSPSPLPPPPYFLALISEFAAGEREELAISK